MRFTTLAGLIGIGMSLAVAGPASAFEKQAYDAKTFAAAQSAGKPILVDIAASWCPTCKAQHRVLKDLEATEAGFAGITIFEVDYDTQKDVVAGLKANRQSTLIAFNGTKETGRLVGETRPDELAALLTSALPNSK